MLCKLPRLQGERAMSSKKPNVLVVLTDDQGFGDCSFYGNPVLKTPHMDSIATEGISFEQFHVTPMCAPTRGAFFSGVHPMRNMALSTTDGRHCLRPELPCMPQAFADAGYRTALFGKWHQGRNWPNRPQDKGFQHFRGHYGFGTTGISCHWNCDYQDPIIVNELGEYSQAEGFCTDVFFNECMDWIGDDEQPFYAVLSTNAPHFPFWAPHDLTEQYKDTDNPEFFAMMKNIDDNIGRMQAFLKESDIYDDTVVLFFTDNGPVGGRSTYTAGLRGGKGTPWEGGHNVPLFVRFPSGGIAGGRVVTGLCTVEDLYPTLLDICDVAAPDDAAFDGMSIAAAMRGEEDEIAERRLVVQIDRGSITPKTACIMYRDWRIVWSDSLYNVAEDRHQDHQIAEQHPDVFYDMWKNYQQWFGPLSGPAEETLPEHIGNPAQELVTLDSSEARGGTDGQAGVRTATNKRGKLQGPWLVEAHRSGRYQITLRRWPAESGLKLDEGTPPFETRCSGKPEPEGVALPIVHGLLTVDGFQYQETVTDDPTAICFDIELEAGRHELIGAFADNDHQPLCSAFYADICFNG